MFRTIAATALLCLTLLPAQAAGHASASVLEAQRAAQARIAQYDGVWRGEATIYNADGTQLKLTQTERVGTMLGATVRVIEGRGHLPDGSLVFNALAVISFAPQSGKYNFRSYAQGFAGDFPLELHEGGFVWSMNAGPAVIRYTSTVKDNTWTEVGERILPGQPAVRTFEMRLTKVGSTDWPAAGAPSPR